MSAQYPDLTTFGWEPVTDGGEILYWIHPDYNFIIRSTDGGLVIEDSGNTYPCTIENLEYWHKDRNHERPKDTMLQP